MTTATLPEETRDSITAMRQEFERRWVELLRDTERWRGKDDAVFFNSTNSKRFKRINNTLEELAALLVDGETMQGEDDSLLHVTEEIWDEIQERLIAWAMEVHATRERYRREHIEPAAMVREELEAALRPISEGVKETLDRYTLRDGDPRLEELQTA